MASRHPIRGRRESAQRIKGVHGYEYRPIIEGRPVATSGKAVDGTVTWMFAYDVPNRSALGEALYLALGNPGAWADEPTPDDLTGTYIDTVSAIESAIALFRLAPSDISLGATRINWASGTIVPEWPATDSYVLVDLS